MGSCVAIFNGVGTSWIAQFSNWSFGFVSNA